MARARNIKPGFCRNEDVAECSVWARLCFALLPMLADREGRLEDRPKRIKGELFPFDSVEVEPLLAELVERGLISRYTVDGLGLIQILGFRKHQNPHHREPESTLSPHPGLRLDADGKYVKPEALVPCKDTKASGKPEASPDIARPSRADSLIPDSLIPDSGFLIQDAPPASPPVVGIPLVDGTEFGVSASMVEEWSVAFPAVSVLQQLRGMRVWCMAHPAKRKTKRGANAFIVSWLSREQDKGGRREPHSPSAAGNGVVL